MSPLPAGNRFGQREALRRQWNQIREGGVVTIGLSMGRQESQRGAKRNRAKHAITVRTIHEGKFDRTVETESLKDKRFVSARLRRQRPRERIHTGHYRPARISGLRATQIGPRYVQACAHPPRARLAVQMMRCGNPALLLFARLALFVKERTNMLRQFGAQELNASGFRIRAKDFIRGRNLGRFRIHDISPVRTDYLPRSLFCTSAAKR
jgi:hypothetical protein